MSYALRRDLRLNLGAEFSGGEYQLHEERAGAKVIRYRDFRFLGGVDFAVGRRYKAELAVGYALDRKFQFYELFDPNRPDIKVAAGPFLRAGLKVE